jgi:hypothetical protein
MASETLALQSFDKIGLKSVLYTPLNHLVQPAEAHLFW